MKRQLLTARERKVLGKKVKHLRKKGVIPASLYGKNIKSQSLELDLKAFSALFQQAGETTLVDLTIEGEKEVHPILIHHVQKHPVTGYFLHADFHQVSLKDKMKAAIPLALIGTSSAASQKKGILIQVLNDVEIEALPTDLLEKIDVDITNLKEVNDEIKVTDLKVDSSKVTILTDKNQVIVKIGPLEEIAPEPTPVTEAAPIAGEEVVAEGAEGAAPAATGKPAEAPAKEAPKAEKPQK